MKARLFAIGLLLLAFATCTSRTKVAEHGQGIERPSPTLSAIDSLMWRQPDSAFAVLQQFAASPMADSLDVFNGHYCQLLISELLYKNDCGQSNRPALQQAVAYFDSLTLTLNDTPPSIRPIASPSFREGGTLSPTRNDIIIFLDARAHYINGVGYYEQGNMEEACAEYLKTLETMETHFEKKVLTGHRARFMAYTYNRLGEMFSEQFMMEPAIECINQSYEFSKIEPASPYSVSNALYRIGLQYDKMRKEDSANLYYERAIELMPDNNNLIYRDLESSRALLSYQMEQSAESSLKTLLRMVQFADDEEERLTRFLTIGYIYFEEKMYDSALQYLEPVFQHTNDVVMRIQAADFIRTIYDSEGMGKNSDEYVRFSAVNKKLNGQNNAEVLQLNKQFKEYKDKQLERQTAAEKAKERERAIIVIGSLLFAMLMIIIFYVRNKRHKRKLETQIEAERHSHKMQQAALAGRLKRSNALLKEQDKSVSSINPLSFAQQPEGAECYAEEPVCRQILSVCNDNNNPIKSTVPVSAYASLALTDAQKAQLKDAAMRHYGPLFEKLKLQYPELKEKDYLYCQLSLLGLDNVQIAVLTQLSYRTIWEREKRLQTLFHADDRIAVILHEMMMH